MRFSSPLLFPPPPLASTTLKTLTFLNKEVRPFLLGDNSIWKFPSVSSLSESSIEVLKAFFSLAIIAFGAFEFMVLRYYIVA